MRASGFTRLIPALILAVASSAAMSATHWPDSWIFIPPAGESVFTIEEGNSDHAHLQVGNDRNVGQLFMKTAIPLTRQIRLKWRWNVHAIPSQVAENTPTTHQYYAVAVRFDNDQVLSYIWSAELPVGTVFPCPLPAWANRETHIVLHSGKQDLNSWLSEERDLLADYTRFKNRELPSSIAQVWVIAASPEARSAMTLADISISNGADTVQFLQGRGFSQRDRHLAAIHASLSGTWSGHTERLDAGTGKRSRDAISVSYSVASTDGLDYAYSGPAGISLARYGGDGAFTIEQFPYAGKPSQVQYRIEKLIPPDAAGNWTVHELVTLTQSNRTTVQWRQTWSLENGMLKLQRDAEPVAGKPQDSQRYLGYSLRKDAPR